MNSFSNSSDCIVNRVTEHFVSYDVHLTAPETIWVVARLAEIGHDRTAWFSEVRHGATGEMMAKIDLRLRRSEQAALHVRRSRTVPYPSQRRKLRLNLSDGYSSGMF
jgi:hypothetical protein